MLYGSHSEAASVQDTHFVTEHSHAYAAVKHDHKAPCNDAGQTHRGCASTSSCAFCAPVTAGFFLSVTGREPAATAASFVSLPADVPIRLRPPKLVVTA